ncbi:MAG: S-layer y domain protein [Firmicutes bacterium]|nr:S-layer y domain protein [Bacillota bacterium]
MKKIIAIVLTAMFCFASIAAAAGSQFSDVPTKHWAYGAIGKLVKAGIVDGYGDGNFHGDKTMTRYEMAQIVANVMAKEDKVDAENKALIEKLAKEFSDELKVIGARVDNLEKKADNFHYFGIVGNRYDHWKNEGVADRSNVFILNTFYKINDNFTAITSSEVHKVYMHDEQQVGNAGSTFPNPANDWNSWGVQAYVEGIFDGFSTKLGRFTYIPAYGLTHGLYLQVEGVQLTFGNLIKTTLVGGQNTDYVPGGTFASMGYRAADVVAPLSAATNLKVSYQQNQSNWGLAPAAAYASITHNKDYINYWEGGFDSKLSKDVAFEAAYIKSSYDEDNKGYYARLKYKDAIPFVPKSYDFYVTYHNLENNSIMSNDDRYYGNLKGVRVGVQWVPWNSTMLTVWYDMQKYINSAKYGTKPGGVHNVTSGERENMFRAQLDFFFK